VWHGGAVGVFGHGMSKIPHGFAGPLETLKIEKSRRDAGGTNGECEKNDVAREASICNLRRVAT